MGDTWGVPGPMTPTHGSYGVMTGLGRVSDGKSGVFPGGRASAPPASIPLEVRPPLLQERTDRLAVIGRGMGQRLQAG